MCQYIVLEFFFLIFNKVFILKDEQKYNIATIKVQMLIKILIFVFPCEKCVETLYIFVQSPYRDKDGKSVIRDFNPF